MTRFASFIRLGACGRMSALIELSQISLAEAAAQVIRELAQLDGKGGMIAVNRHYQIAMPFNTTGMFRGAVAHDRPIEVAIW